MAAFDLSRNPFIVLGISPRAERSEINSAFQEKSLDAESPEDERSLDMARQTLLTPRDRLFAEVTYLLEMRPADVRRALSVDQANDWIKISNSTTGVARANALAQACTLKLSPQKRRELAKRLIEANSEIAIGELCDTLHEQRAVAGFDTISREAASSALAELTIVHANVIVENLSKHPSFEKEISHILQESDALSEQGQRLIRRIVDTYERTITKDLDRHAEEVISSLRSFSAWSAKSGFDDFEAALRQWQKLAHPLQISDRLLGADEAHSSALFGRIRELATELAGEKNRFADALGIVRLAREIFAELPDATAKLDDDIVALEAIEDDLAVQKVVGPLFAAVKAAEADIPGTIRALAKRGFYSTADSPIGDVVGAYQEIVDAAHSERVLALAVGLVRQLAITLNNDHNDPEGSAKIIGQLRAGASIPHSMLEILEDDQRALDRDQASRRFEASMREGNLQQAKLACEQLIQLADNDEKAQLQRLRQELETRISKGRAKAFLGWGAAAAFAVYLVAKEPSTSAYDQAAAEASADYDAMPDYYSDTETSFDAPVANEDIDRAIDAVMSETPPPLYGSAPLNKAQLRYCLKQSERVSAARDFVYSAAQQSRFNAAVDDYNGRCGQFRYSMSDKADIDAEIQLERSELNEQGRAMVGPGSPVPRPVITEPPVADIERALPRPNDRGGAEENLDSVEQLMRDLKEDASRE